MSIKWLIKEIRSARKARLAKQVGWADPVIGNLASPIIVEKQCVATLGIDVPRHRLEGKDESALYRSVREGAARLSRRLWQMQLDSAKERMRRNSSLQGKGQSLK
jgi:DNA-binding IclR family transcriptional regulator